MTHTPARRLRAGLTAASAVALTLLVPGTAGPPPAPRSRRPTC
ncbi:hypothetical protein ACFQ2M_27680 [Kitasatospora saccharophila]